MTVEELTGAPAITTTERSTRTASPTCPARLTATGCDVAPDSVSIGTLRRWRSQPVTSTRVPLRRMSPCGRATA